MIVLATIGGVIVLGIFLYGAISLMKPSSINEANKTNETKEK